MRISHERPFARPEEQPAFSAACKWVESSYSVIGHFQDYTPNIARIRCGYSWDGRDYTFGDSYYPNWELDAMGDESALERLENQEVFLYYEEPLVSFLSGGRDSFYVRLEITEELGLVDGEVQYAEPYYSQPVLLSRDPQPQPLPDTLTALAAFGLDFAVSEVEYGGDWGDDGGFGYSGLVDDGIGGDWEVPPVYTCGQFRMTVRETPRRTRSWRFCRQRPRSGFGFGMGRPNIPLGMCPVRLYGKRTH